MTMRIHTADYLGYRLELREAASGALTVRLIDGDKTFRLDESLVDSEHGKQRAMDVARNRRQAAAPKLGFLGWGFEGGFFAGGVAGSWAGSAGVAALVLGVSRMYGALGNPNLGEEHRTNLWVALLAFAAFGVCCLAGGYMHYRGQCEDRFFREQEWKTDAPEWAVAGTAAE